MTRRKLTVLGAAFAGALLAASAGANDQHHRMMQSGDRAAASPSSANETTPAPTRARAGEPVMPRDASPTGVSESNPTIKREYQAPPARSDNPNLPNPVTPSAANESAPQPQAAKSEPTNQPGIPPRAPVGGTR